MKTNSAASDAFSQKVQFSVTLAVTSLSEAQAQQPRQNQGLPKVDFQIGQIQKLGQGIAISVTNRGLAMSPATTVSVAIHDLQSRRLLTTKSLSLPPMQPNQTRRVIVVPPSPGQPIMVRATVDPRNRVQESNERNNATASRRPAE